MTTKPVRTGTLPAPDKRRTLSGRLLARLDRRGFAFLPVGGGRHVNPEHPSRKHDVPRPQVARVTPTAPVPGQARRRDRRPSMVAAAKADRRTRGGRQ